MHNSEVKEADIQVYSNDGGCPLQLFADAAGEYLQTDNRWVDFDQSTEKLICKSFGSFATTRTAYLGV